MKLSGQSSASVFKVLLALGATSVFLTAATPPIIVTQPADATVLAPAVATFQVMATGSPAPTYQWKVSTDGGSTWANVSTGTGGIAATYKTPATTLAMQDRKFCVVVKNTAGTVTSDPATLTVNAVPVITSQPFNQSVFVPTSAFYTAVATGYPALNYQWQVSIDKGTSWMNVIAGTNADSAAYMTEATSLLANGRKYRVVISNSVGSVTSSAADLSIKKANFIQAALLTNHVIITNGNGKVYGWGSNDGVIDYTSGTVKKSPTAIAMPTGTVPCSVITAGTYALALTSGNKLINWGYSVLDCLPQRVTMQPAVKTDIQDVTDFSGWSNNCLAVNKDGVVKVWGQGGYGYFADASKLTLSTPVPQPIPQLIGHFIAAVAAGDAALALEWDGHVWAWGDNANGCVGNRTSSGDDPNHPTSKIVNNPTQVQTQDGTPLDQVVAIYTGLHNSFAIRSDWTVWGWGQNGNGYLGCGIPGAPSIPYAVQVQLPPPTPIQHVVAISNGDTHSLAVMNDGTVWAWGYNNFGQLGDGTTSNSACLPKQVVGLSNIAVVSAGKYCSFAIAADGSIWSWGQDTSYQLGLGTSTPLDANGNPTINVLIPTPIPNFKIPNFSYHLY